MVLERRLEKIKRVVSQRQKGLAIVIEDVHDPHNAEAIFRTCDAFGVQDVYLIFDKTKPWNPAKIGKQSSSSAHKWLTFHTFRSTKECLAELKKKGYFLVASALKDSAVSLFDYSFSDEKIALLVGNEHRGLSDEALALADVVLQIPMRGMVESLNVSVSTALFLFEITRQRTGKHLFSLPSPEQKELIESFVMRSHKGVKRLGHKRI
ncbi:MAG: RNA methyltransferase [Nanoarchaeota archaeon]